MKHPIQPIAPDDRGTPRFKQNAIVVFLLDNGGFTMNDLAMKDFPREDREQFAQLIGYSVDGFAELSYASPESIAAADRMAQLGESETQARINHLESTLAELRKKLAEPVSLLYGVDPSDLGKI